MLPFPEQQHKVGTSIPLKVHTGLEINCQRRQYLHHHRRQLQSMEPMHGIRSPILHIRTWLKRLQHTLQVAAAKPRTVKYESFVAALICGCAVM